MLFIPERSTREPAGKNAVEGRAVVGPKGKDPNNIGIPKMKVDGGKGNGRR